MKRLKKKYNNIYFGGVYCTSIKSQSKILKTILSCENITQIQKYTDDSSYNFYLRGQSELNSSNPNYDDASRVIETLIKLFNDIKAYSPPPSKFVCLYRGVGPNVELCQAINDCGFMSTSTSIDIAHAFAENFIIKIILIPDYKYKILPLEPITSSKREFEVLLAPGRGSFYPLDISGNTTYKSKKLYTFIYIPQDNSHMISFDKNFHSSNNNIKLFGNLTENQNLTEEKANLWCKIKYFLSKKT